MKTCKKCGDEFETSVKIDDKLRNLNRRQFCLICSPFGTMGKLTRGEFSRTKDGENVYEVVDGEKLKRCSICKQQKGIESFSKKIDGRPFPGCKDCNMERVRLERVETKMIAVEYKGGECVCCGYKKSLSALEFHHLNPEEKDFSFGRKKYLKIEDLKPELDKCILVCSNCHTEIHGGVGNV